MLLGLKKNGERLPEAALGAALGAGLWEFWQT